MSDREIRPPAPRPCVSCPYRQDVPSGVWSDEEYAKLPPYDGETAEQPVGVFLCHQQDGRVCAGWCATHDMDEALSIRMAAALEAFTPETHRAILEYETAVPTFESGAAAAEHGRRQIERPGRDAIRVIGKLERRREARGGS